jgi:hypothetical protein
MKKLILTLAAIPLAAYTAGASAQTYANQTYANAGGTVGVQNRIANLETRFNAGISAGVFTNAQRNSISRQLTELRNLERSYSYNGLSEAERRTLQQRIRRSETSCARPAGRTGPATMAGAMRSSMLTATLPTARVALTTPMGVRCRVPASPMIATGGRSRTTTSSTTNMDVQSPIRALSTTAMDGRSIMGCRDRSIRAADRQ